MHDLCYAAILKSMSRKIGVYSGTFDPPHDGHRAFVDAAIDRCGLDRVYILPEPSPRDKYGVTPQFHRINMSRLVFDQPACQIQTIESGSITLDSVETALQLPERFYLLLGSDAVLHLAHWDKISTIIERATFVIGLRQSHDERQLTSYLEELSVPKSRVTYIRTDFAEYGSTHARTGQTALHGKIADYAHEHGLYGV